MSRTNRFLILCSIVVAALVAVIFRRQFCVAVTSGVPLLFSALSIFLVFYFRTEKKDGETTAYGSALTEREQQKLSACTSLAFACLVPWQGVLIFFFAPWAKYFSVALFLAGYLLGPCLFRLRYGKEIARRLERERSELEIQRKMEEDGVWK